MFSEDLTSVLRCALLFLLDLFVPAIATLRPLKQSDPKAAGRLPDSIRVSDLNKRQPQNRPWHTHEDCKAPG